MIVSLTEINGTKNKSASTSTSTNGPGCLALAEWQLTALQLSLVKMLECRLWVDCDNSPLPKAVIHYWRNRIGIGGRQRIGTGGCFQSEWLAVFGRNTHTGGAQREC